MLQLLERIFLRRGYKVLKAANGQTALDTYQQYKGEIGVVLLDMGQALELDAKNNVLWRIQNLIFPLDVQYLSRLTDSHSRTNRGWGPVLGLRAVRRRVERRSAR